MKTTAYFELPDNVFLSSSTSGHSYSEKNCNAKKKEPNLMPKPVLNESWKQKQKLISPQIIDPKMSEDTVYDNREIDTVKNAAYAIVRDKLSQMMSNNLTVVTNYYSDSSVELSFDDVTLDCGYNEVVNGKPVEEVEKPLEKVEKPVEEVEHSVEEVENPVEVGKSVEEVEKPVEGFEGTIEEESDINPPENEILEEDRVDRPSEAPVGESKSGYLCECGQLFKSLGWYNRHLNSCTGSHVCNECNVTFKTRNVLKMHIKNIHKNIFQCSKCEFTFNTVKKLQKHFELLHGEGVQCRFCDRVLKNKESLRKHVAKFHNKKNKQTKKCREVPSAEGFKCKECFKSFKWPGSLRKHRAQHKAVNSIDQVQQSSQSINPSVPYNDPVRNTSDTSTRKNSDSVLSEVNSELSHHSEENDSRPHDVNKVQMNNDIEVVVLNDDGSMVPLGFVNIAN